jgi:hypothetical protein
VVTRAELVRASITLDEIKHRLRTGALLREHRGVYRVGHRAPSIEARYLAAVLAAGDEACLSGRAAAFVYGLIKGAAPPRTDLAADLSLDALARACHEAAVRFSTTPAQVNAVLHQPARTTSIVAGPHSD